ncbi:transposase [bacterium]|nr:transposase [bacterium]
MDDLKRFFLNPTQATHKRYETMRALCVERLPAKEVADRFGYSIYSINTMKRSFAKAINSQKIDATYFFVTHNLGRHIDTHKAGAKERIIQLRKAHYSILDIKGVLQTEGHRVSHDYIHRLLREEGFIRLPRRTQIERKRASSKTIRAPKSRPINWKEDDKKTFHSERGIGILPFLPLLAWLNVDQWIESASYPETTELNRVQSVLSFIALKLSGHDRYSQDDLWAMDRGFGLFGGLNLLPKDGTLSSYSYRTSRGMNRKFLTVMFHRLKGLGLLSGIVNMDFTAIPHWGDASILENNWSGKRGKALKSVLSALCQDPDTGIFCYSNAEIKHRNQPECVLEFVNFWKQGGGNPTCLIFDSKFTTYQNLERLDRDHIKFITIRRRGKGLLASLKELSKEDWEDIRVEGPDRKYEKVKVNESEITLPNTNLSLRQIVLSDHGREKETFIITNDREPSASQIIRQYARRWNVEKGISEQIEFFHLNSLSSSIVVKVDFDLTMTIAAHNFYRIMAQNLTGFERESSSSLNSKFFAGGGQFTVDKDTITIEMKKRRHLPILMDALEAYQETPIPWLSNRRLVFKLWATS